MLPIPAKNSGLEPYQIALKNAKQFPLFTKFKLTVNMRASTESTEWKECLMEIGNGTAPLDGDERIDVPQELMRFAFFFQIIMCFSRDLIADVFEGKFDDPDHLQSRAILCSKNRRVDAINNDILDLMTSIILYLRLNKYS